MLFKKCCITDLGSIWNLHWGIRQILAIFITTIYNLWLAKNINKLSNMTKQDYVTVPMVNLLAKYIFIFFYLLKHSSTKCHKLYWLFFEALVAKLSPKSSSGQVSWTEISFIITAQPSTRPPTHLGIVVL